MLLVLALARSLLLVLTDGLAAGLLIAPLGALAGVLAVKSGGDNGESIIKSKSEELSSASVVRDLVDGEGRLVNVRSQDLDTSGIEQSLTQEKLTRGSSGTDEENSVSAGRDTVSAEDVLNTGELTRILLRDSLKLLTEAQTGDDLQEILAVLEVELEISTDVNSISADGASLDIEVGNVTEDAGESFIVGNESKLDDFTNGEGISSHRRVL